jgi:hypothetical protein
MAGRPGLLPDSAAALACDLFMAKLDRTASGYARRSRESSEGVSAPVRQETQLWPIATS